jgi:predicted transcriptional regulator
MRTTELKVEVDDDTLAGLDRISKTAKGLYEDRPPEWLAKRAICEFVQRHTEGPGCDESAKAGMTVLLADQIVKRPPLDRSRVLELRKQGYTQMAVAQMTGCSIRTVARIEKAAQIQS